VERPKERQGPTQGPRRVWAREESGVVGLGRPRCRGRLLSAGLGFWGENKTGWRVWWKAVRKKTGGEKTTNKRGKTGGWVKRPETTEGMRK